MEARFLSCHRKRAGLLAASLLVPAQGTWRACRAVFELIHVSRQRRDSLASLPVLFDQASLLALSSPASTFTARQPAQHHKAAAAGAIQTVRLLPRYLMARGKALASAAKCIADCA